MSAERDLSYCAFCGHSFATDEVSTHVVTFDEEHNYIRCWSR